MKRNFLILGACVVMVFPHISEAAVVTGSGSSESEALKDAMRIAVEQEIGTVLSSETMVENSIIIQDEILAKSQGYVRSYKILETKQNGGAYLVKADVTVASEPGSALLDTLDMLKLLNDPRIVVLVDEKNNTSYLDNGACEAKLTQALLDAGYKRVNEGHVLAAQKGYKISSNNANELIAIAKNLDADYLVIGTANGDSTADLAQAIGYGDGKSGMRTFNGTLDYKVVKVDTAKVVCSGSTKGIGMELTASAGLQSAYLKAAEDAAGQIVAKMKDEAGVVNKNVTINCTVHGYAEVDALKKELSHISGVNGVYVRSYSNRKAVIEVDYAKSASSLLDSLQRRSALRYSVIRETPSIADIKIE